MAWLPSWIDNEWFFAGGPDVRFDEFLNVSTADQDRLYEWLKVVLDGPRKRKRRPADLNNLKLVLGCVIANSIAALARVKVTRVHFSRGTAAYRSSTPYKPDGFHSTHLIHVVDALSRAGFLKSSVGTRGSATRKARRYRSTFRGLAPLASGLAERGVGQEQIHVDQFAAPVVILRDGQGKNLPYDLTAVADETSALRGFNAFMADHELALPLTGGLTLARYPNFSSKRLRRIYNVTLDKGGRFYGGWWQGQPKEIRRHITIDGEQTAELDFGGLHPRLLYHLAGSECPHDPYEVGEIRTALEGAGVSWSEGRGMVKTTLLAMINAKSGRGLHQDSQIKRLSQFIRPTTAYAAIRKHNEQISDRLFSGYGLTLMKLDSDLCADILADALEDEIPILPIHDSFVVREGDADWLRNIMSSRYRSRFGFEPLIE